MARTETTQIPLGFKAPTFELSNGVDSKTYTFNDVKGEKGTVVMFICNHCPFVVHVREELVKIANDYLSQGIGFVAISSNDVENYPQDSPALMKQLAEEMSFPFPYLYDESQEVAKAFDAACTPDFSVFGADDVCAYRGQMDGSRPGNGVAVDGVDMRRTLDLLVVGNEVPAEGQMPSIGCNIKWKA